MPFMPSLWTTALIVLAFFFAYYVYEPPYRGLYPDLLPTSTYGRSQGIQHIMRGVALGLALVGGGFLFHAWKAAPFLVAAFVTTLACGGVIVLIREDVEGTRRAFEGVRSYLARSWLVLSHEPDVRRFLIANAAWEGTFAAARTFVVLYITRGLGQPLSTNSFVLATVAIGYVIAAIGSGWLGDRFGLARVIWAASFLYGFGLLGGGLATQWHDWYYAVILPVAVAGGCVMTLAWGLLFKLMPAEHRGAISGLATWTKGFGLIVGPIVVGGAIDIFGPYLDSTDGYQLLWPLCAVPILAAIPLVASLVKHEAHGTSVLPRA